ncbi:MAG: NADH-quinone oxidoreductase subunit L [archaeon]|nr:NADH-quinone oxidoreductase subunit L [archaeon]
MLDYSWLVPVIPVACFVFVGLFCKKKPQIGGYIAITGAALSCILASIISYEYLTSGYYSSNKAFTMAIEWIKIGGFSINFGIYIDGLSCIMMLFASFISTMIFVYSLGYMHDQGEKKRRYYAEVSLFLTGMLGLVISSNYLEMFIFWEIMGLCSYLLIGFWSFDHPEAKEKSSAAKKAFLVTRMGDVCLIGGLFILLWVFKSLDYNALFAPDAIKAVTNNEYGVQLVTIASFLIFGGVIGKSAQFPLHDWLPDAMAGPTTVSALIHAATMVKAGVYLTARSFPLFVYNSHMGEQVLLFIGVIGGFTAIFAASQALNNMNIKKVLAFSTLSQLGYMILALGAGGYLMCVGIKNGNEGLIALGASGYIAGVFHMLNHAFFKGLLFLCSGSVIHSTGTEDMRLMGGLIRKMPVTSITMLLGSLSIAGFPLFSGFWSKDMVLEAAFGPFEEGFGFGSVFCVLFLLGLITAFMTAFYMFRMWFMTFVGEPRENAQHCHGESPLSMSVPLIVLSIFAVYSGILILFGLGYVINESLISSGINVEKYSSDNIVMTIFSNQWTYISIALALIGIFIAYLMYDKKEINPGILNKNGKSFVYRLLADRYHFPQIYDHTSWGLGYGVARVVNYFDRNVVDGTVNGLSNAIVESGKIMRKMQSGFVRDYARYIIIGVIVLVSTLFLMFLTGGFQCQ